MEDKLYNLQAQQLAAQVANWAAQLEFQKERFRLLEMPQFQQGLQLEVDKFAWQKAEDTWKKAYQESVLTGMYNGQPTTQWLMDQARLTGTFNGERTLEGRLTDAQIKDMNDKMKLANDQFLAATTGYFNGQKTFDRQKFEAAQALEGWKFISTLSGPQNAFKQARAIGSMPGGMNQMMQAFAGQYMLPGSTSVGTGGAGGENPAGQLDDMLLGGGGNAPAPGQPVQAQPVPPTGTIPGRGFNQQTQWNDATRGAAAAWEQANPQYVLDGSQVGYHLRTASDTPNMIRGGYSYQPEGVQAPTDAWNYSANRDGSVATYPPGVASPAATADVSSQTPMVPQQAATILNSGYQYGASVPNYAQQTPLPNQINAENYENAYQYQKELLWANYEDQGWDKGLAQEAYLKSLPKYGGPDRGAIAF